MDEVYGMAHITGGGIPENLPRCLPKGLKAHVDWNLGVPEIFMEIQRKGNVDELEMRRVFNLYRILCSSSCKGRNLLWMLLG